MTSFLYLIVSMTIRSVVAWLSCYHGNRVRCNSPTEPCSMSDYIGVIYGAEHIYLYKDLPSRVYI